MEDEKRRTLKKKPATKKPKAQAEKKLSTGGLFSRKKPTNQRQINKPESPETIAGTGTVILAKGALLGKIAAWTLVAFVVLGSVMSVIQFLTPSAKAQGVVEAVETTTSQQAGDYARGFVGSWLRATRDDADALARYKTISRGEVTSKTPAEFRDLAVASVEMDKSGIATVIVSAEVLTKIKDEGQVTAEAGKDSAWIPAWFQVNVQHADDQFIALGWPAPIPATPAGVASEVSYSYAGSADIKSTVEAFFLAYVLDEGDVSRMTHPESGIQALGPNPYTAVTVTSITTDTDFEKNVPADGTSTRTLIDLSLGASDGTSRAATYALTLETRGGRWEVKAMDSAPVVTPSKPVTPTPQQ